MTTDPHADETARPATAATELVGGRKARVLRLARRASGLARRAPSGTMRLLSHVPGTLRATRAGAQNATSALQTLPDSTLSWLAASSVGLSAGLRIARAPRLVVAAGAVPALLVGAAIALRPIEPASSPVLEAALAEDPPA